jgi:hypothetical protein
MARIRNIKPDFWTDEKLVELETWERLLFIGLWNFADDEGYMAYSPKRIKMQVFPGDSLEVSRGIQSLISIGAVRIFDSELGPVLHITNWSKHQKVSNPSKSKYSSIRLVPQGQKPQEPQKHADPTPDPLEDYRNSTEDSGELCKEREGEWGREGELKDLSEPAGSNETARRFAYPSEFMEFWTAYPRKDAKRAALTAWQKARKTTSNQELIDGAARFAADPNRDPAFTPLPASWLNAGRWEDGPLPPRYGAVVNKSEERMRANLISLQGWQNGAPAIDPFEQKALGQ